MLWVLLQHLVVFIKYKQWPLRWPLTTQLNCDIIYTMNSKEFSLEIEKIVQAKRGISYMDAVLKYCDDNEIDPGSVGSLISKPLKDKIAIEAQNLNYLPKTGQLPV